VACAAVCIHTRIRTCMYLQALVQDARSGRHEGPEADGLLQVQVHSMWCFVV
jgi:hypothetical protein